MLETIEQNLILIGDKIKKTCEIYGRNESEISLIAVSKMVEEQKIITAIKAGCKVFGENYIQEAKEKWPKIRTLFPEIKLHFIGHLQSNKASEAILLFDVIESLDSEKLANSLSKEVKKQKKNTEFFVQVNIGDEEQKAGISVKETQDFINFCRKECELNVTGLMCIPPSNQLASPYFALLGKLAKESGLKNLSMGMSSDFEEGIALGANYIRIGTAIFGERSVKISN